VWSLCDYVLFGNIMKGFSVTCEYAIGDVR